MNAQVIISLIILVVAITFFAYSYFKEGGLKFLSDEKRFDEKYFEIRKKHLAQLFDYRIFDRVNSMRLEDMKLPKAILPYSWTDPKLEKLVYLLPQGGYNKYMSIIYDIYEDIKDFESPISKKFFEPRPIKIDYWNGEEGYDIRTIVRNIVSNIPSKEYLSITELQHITFLANEIAINGVSKDPKKLESLNEIESHRINDSKKDIYHGFTYLFEFDQTSLLLEGLGKELSINMNIYGIVESDSVEPLPVTTVSNEQPLKELNYLNFSDSLCGLKIKNK